VGGYDLGGSILPCLKRGVDLRGDYVLDSFYVVFSFDGNENTTGPKSAKRGGPTNQRAKLNNTGRGQTGMHYCSRGR